ncbi:ubiquitin-specific protease [Amylostereum chailletii]|nr:ubiquitin-specific protease [Amylostereum chailletii]
MSEEDDSSGWQLTESDPGVFTELLKTLGVPLVVDDLYSLDAGSLTPLQPLRALIFLFKWLPGAGEPSSTGGTYDEDFPGFFAHQVVNNACATLAVLNALGNIPELPQGQPLADLISFTTGMDAQTRGMVITSADWLREAHNALSPPAAISLDGLNLPKTTEDAYHFVVYLPALGSVYELDGLKPSPIRHGAYQTQGEGWIHKAREVVEARIATYPAGALEFSLLALHDDPLPALQQQLQAFQQSGNGAAAAEVAQQLANENAKRERWAFENSLRRHNHLGLIHALLVALGKSGRLVGATEGARAAMRQRVEARRAKGQSAMDED